MNYNFDKKKDGFQILKNILSPDEIDKIRITLEKIFR